MEYFGLLVFTFEGRIKAYRQQLDELEMYLSAPTQMHNFSPQGSFHWRLSMYLMSENTHIIPDKA